MKEGNETKTQLEYTGDEHCLPMAYRKCGSRHGEDHGLVKDRVLLASLDGRLLLGDLLTVLHQVHLHKGV